MKPYNYNNYYIKHHEENTATTSCGVLKPAMVKVSHIFQETCKNIIRRKEQHNNGSNNNKIWNNGNKRGENKAILVFCSDNERMINDDCIYTANTTTTTTTTLNCCNVLKQVKTDLTQMLEGIWIILQQQKDCNKNN